MRSSIRCTYTDFAGSVKPVKRLMNSIRKNAASALRDSNVREQHETIQCASVVVMSGYLETFIKDLSKTFFDELKLKGTGLQVLEAAEPENKYALTHFRNGAKLLAQMTKSNSANLSYCEDLIKRLHAPIINENEPPAWEAFAFTEANPGPKVLKRFLKDLGIQDPFKSVSDSIGNAYSDTYFETSLTSFIKIRNECAHSGKAKQIPSPQTIDDHVNVLRALTLGICKVVDARVSLL